MNPFNFILETLPAFIEEHLDFHSDEYNQAELVQFWIDIGCEGESAQTLADLSVIWTEGKLKVHERQRLSGELLDSLHHEILTAFRFQKFTSSMWITMCKSCRTLVVSAALGLLCLLSEARQA